ncbi:MAG TPA: aminofutalosine synthase MqnE [Acidobacteriota bacterium]|nr:aminofutalosine synthase MqnE [Acidobacteriota bacterium]
MIAEIHVQQSQLKDIADKVFAGVRLEKLDGIRFYESHDLLTLGYLANHVREKLHGKNAYFNVNRHIEPTNVCVLKCGLCAFGKNLRSPDAYTFSLEEIFARAREGADAGATEFHIVGGLHPDLPFQYYLDMLKGLKQRLPQIHLKAFTAVEIQFFADLEKISVQEVLHKLMDAGLDSMPGGGAEIFADRVREIICKGKISGQQWLDIVRVAHRMGLHSNATMLYGHVETYEERVDHMLALRDLQDETHGFMTFIPLAFHSANTPLDYLPETTGFDDLKNIAVARLLLDNFPHIKSYWIMIGTKMAQMALRFGADDIDGTVVEEKITHAAGASTPQALSRAELVRMIREVGCVPVERDTLYEKLQPVS